MVKYGAYGTATGIAQRKAKRGGRASVCVQTNAYLETRSAVSTIAEKPAAAPFEVEFLYSVRDPGPKGGARRAEDILFLERIASAFPAAPGEDAGAPGTKAIKGRLRLFLTPGGSEGRKARVGR